MKITSISRGVAACLTALPLVMSGCAQADNDAPAGDGRIVLESADTVLEITPSYGGRVTAFHLKGHDNIIWFDEAVAAEAPDPAVSLTAPDLPVFGHSTWVGPQADWWNKQEAAPARKGEIWPPDPYLVIARTKVAEQSGDRLVLEGPDSEISGIAMIQTYTVAGGVLDLTAEIRNVRDEALSWDIWFNTRVKGDALIYAPVDGEGSVYTSDMGATDGPFERPAYSVADGIFTLDQVPPSGGKQGRRGKIMVRPDEGWMAAFRDGQAFIVTFDLADNDAIHPDQAQLEFYMDKPKGQQGMIEMEFHSPYVEMAPGEGYSAAERWHVLAYEGADTREAHIEFLMNAVAELTGE